MTPADRLRAIAAALPVNGTVTLSRDALLELAGEAGESPPSESRKLAADLTIADVAALLGRSSSCVRNWLAEKPAAFPNAYRMRGREWRVPRTDIEAFQRTEAQRHQQRTESGRGNTRGRSESIRLNAWRDVAAERDRPAGAHSGRNL